MAHSRSSLILFVAIIIGVAACGGGEAGPGGGLGGTVLIDGSSTVYPLTEAVAEEFTLRHERVRIPVGVSGTGGGFAKLLRGEIDVNDASRPIKPSESEAAARNGIAFIELPVAYDGLAVVANPAADWVDCLTTEEIQRIWRPNSDVTRWSQVRPGFPDRPIHLYGPGTDSGTYDYFTEAIVGEEGASRTDFTASEDDNVLVQGIRGDANALGFFGMAYYQENQNALKLIGVDDGDASNGEGCTVPSTESVRDGTYQPLSRPLFIYVRESSAADSTVAAFVTFYLEQAGTLSGQVGYVALSDEAYELTLDRFDRRVTGSVLADGGSQVGVRMEDLLRHNGAGTGDGTSSPPAHAGEGAR